jgi:hypothetical protein
MTTIDPTHMRHGANESQRPELQTCGLRYQLSGICSFLAITFAVSLEAPRFCFPRAKGGGHVILTQNPLSRETHTNDILAILGLGQLRKYFRRGSKFEPG